MLFRSVLSRSVPFRLKFKKIRNTLNCCSVPFRSVPFLFETPKNTEHFELLFRSVLFRSVFETAKNGTLSIVDSVSVRSVPS